MKAYVGKLSKFTLKLLIIFIVLGFINTKAAQATETAYYPSSVSVTNGVTTSGGVADLAADDSTYWTVQETGAFLMQYNFTGISVIPDTITVAGRYDGNAGHAVELEIWNYSTSAWDAVLSSAKDIPHSGSDYNPPLEFSIPFASRSNYYSGTAPNITMQFRMNHTSGANTKHYMYTDMFKLSNDLSWNTGSADFEIFNSSSLTWDAGTSVCSGSLTDLAQNTISCSSGSVSGSTSYRVQVTLDNIGTTNVLMNGSTEFIDYKNIKAGWAGTSPTLGTCGFYDIDADNGSTTCSVAWSGNDARITNTGTGDVQLASSSGSEGFMFLITTDSTVPSSNATSYLNATIDDNIRNSSKITITGSVGGSLTVDIVDSGGTPVASPAVTFSGAPFSWTTQQSTGTLGVASEKIRLTNTTTTPAWTLSVAATSGPTTLWSGGTYSYDFNGTATTGRLEVDASSGASTPEGGCSNTGVSLGSATYFNQGVTDSITIISADGTADTSCYWDLTGVSLTQDLPARQEADTYSLSLTLTAA